jgi:hypothetical protein
MADSAPPIPAEFWSRIVDFLKAKRTGQISLNINQGSVCNIEIRERFRARGPEETV